MSVCYGLCERIQFLDDPALRTTVQQRLCSISHCRSALISSKTPTGQSAWWGGGLNVLPALSNDGPPLCSLTVISNMRNIQLQRGKVAKCTALPPASRGVGVTENWHFRGQAENPGKHTLLLAFSFVCHKKYSTTQRSQFLLAFKYLLWNSCYSVMNVFSHEVCPLSPEKESWKK